MGIDLTGTGVLSIGGGYFDRGKPIVAVERDDGAYGYCTYDQLNECPDAWIVECFADEETSPIWINVVFPRMPVSLHGNITEAMVRRFGVMEGMRAVRGLISGIPLPIPDQD